MSVVEVLERMGGVATRASLIAATSRLEVDGARQVGDVVAVARGRYALASADSALVAAHRLSGVASHTSAALHYGWQVRLAPDLPHVTLPRGRTLTQEQRMGIHQHRTDLGPDDLADGITTPDRTLVDCLRAASADARAANAFESALRAVAIDVPGLDVVPQVSLRSGAVFLGDRTWATSDSASCWRPTPSSGTATEQRWLGTRDATTGWRSTAGWCCDSRGRT